MNTTLKIILGGLATSLLAYVAHNQIGDSCGVNLDSAPVAATAAVPAVASAEAVATCQTDVNSLLTGKQIKFADGSAVVDASNGALLDELATTLKPCAGTVVEVQGHTSSTGSVDFNRRLSQQRADAVRGELVKRGLVEGQVSAKGYGPDKPLMPEDTANATNRRIEFAISAGAAAVTPVDAAPAADATTTEGGN